MFVINHYSLMTKLTFPCFNNYRLEEMRNTEVIITTDTNTRTIRRLKRQSEHDERFSTIEDEKITDLWDERMRELSSPNNYKLKKIKNKEKTYVKATIESVTQRSLKYKRRKNECDERFRPVEN